MSDADLILQAKADIVELASVNAALRDLLADTLPPRLAPVSAGRVVLDPAHDVLGSTQEPLSWSYQKLVGKQ
jgi:hypothetical protein